ncbi:MAG: hypothetical protein K2H18_02345 [Muribaculaceae bacterium]|nr:hypothetical protein [Muribaculaceae bacterium]
MKHEEIVKLANKIADHLYSRFGNQSHIELMAKEYEDVIKEILQTHCIVEKSEVRESLKELKEDARPVCEWNERVVDTVTLEDSFIYLFGRELFETELNKKEEK